MLRKLLVSFFFVSTISNGQILVDLSNAKSRSDFSFSGALGFSTIEYDSDAYTYEVNRKMLGLGLISNVTSNVNLIFQAGYTFDGKLQDDWKGKGYLIGGGLNFLIYNGRKAGFVGYGFLNYDSEEYKHINNRKIKLDFSNLDFHLGCLFLYQPISKIVIYGGPDLVIYSKGEIICKKCPAIEIERSKIVNFKLGMDLFLDKAILRPEITFIGEKTLVVGVGFSS